MENFSWHNVTKDTTLYYLLPLPSMQTCMAHNASIYHTFNGCLWTQIDMWRECQRSFAMLRMTARGVVILSIAKDLWRTYGESPEIGLFPSCPLCSTILTMKSWKEVAHDTY